MVKVKTERRKTVTEHTTRKANLYDFFNIEKNPKIDVTFKREGGFIIAQQRVLSDEIIAIPNGEDCWDEGVDVDIYRVETTKEV